VILSRVFELTVWSVAVIHWTVVLGCLHRSVRYLNFVVLERSSAAILGMSASASSGEVLDGQETEGDALVGL